MFELNGAQAEVQLLPAGTFRARDGRPFDADAWQLSEGNAPGVIARAAARSNDLVFDYEHQTLNAEYNGQPAPAAAWFHTLEFRAGAGLVATDVRWTERAKAMIEARKYRYASAVFAYRPGTGEVLEILHAGITNDPAIDGMSELASQAAARFSLHYDAEEDTVNPELLKLLGLAEGASDEDINKAVAALTAKIAVMTTIRDELGIDEQGDVAVAIAQLKSKATTGAGDPDPAKFVPIAVVEELKTEVAALRTTMTGNEVDELVKGALDDGKLLPAQEDWARNLGKTNVAALRGYLEKTPPIAALKGKQTTGKDPDGDGGDGELTDSQLAVCKRMGIDPEDYKKTA